MINKVNYLKTNLSILLTFICSALVAQNNSSTLLPDTTLLNGNITLKINGTESRTGAFLKNKGLGETEWNYSVDSVWILNDTMYVQKQTLSKFKIKENSIIVSNGLTSLDSAISLGGNLDFNTTINLNGKYYILSQDSLNYNYADSSTYLIKRSSSNFRSQIEQKNNHFAVSVAKDDTLRGVLSINDSTSSLLFKNSKLSLKDGSIDYNSNEHNFNGNWVKVPTKIHTVIDSLLNIPQGSIIYDSTTKGLYVSDGNKFNFSGIETLDFNEIRTLTPTAWATDNDISIPVLRVRHPNNLRGFNHGKSIDQDYKVIPYEYGMAVEYNGVLEHWVGEFSIHRGLAYDDPGDGGNGWGAVLWVGDDHDSGGLRMTARNNDLRGGNIKFTEISSERFNATSAGNMRFRLVDSTDRVDFVLGLRGSNNVYSYINKFGFKLPEVNGVPSVLSPTKGLMSFDNTDSTLKYYTGADWKTIGNNKSILNDTITTDTVLSYQGNQIKYVNASNGNINITLPFRTKNTAELIFKIIRTDNTSNSVTMSAGINDTINGLSSKNIQNQFDCMNLYTKDTNKWIATKETGY